jgi:hypothetical protein
VHEHIAKCLPAAAFTVFHPRVFPRECFFAKILYERNTAMGYVHLAQVTEADIQEAAKTSLLNDAEKRLHNTVHLTPASQGEPRQGTKKMT